MTAVALLLVLLAALCPQPAHPTDAADVLLAASEQQGQAQRLLHTPMPDTDQQEQQ